MKAVMYHYVRPADPALPYFRHLELADFRRQLDYFCDHFNPVTKAAFNQALATGQPVERGIVLTFDDGFKDHCRYVWPELQQRNLWGIFYIPTLPFTNRKLLSVHRVHMLLGKWGGERIFEALAENITEAMLSDEHRERFQHQTYANQGNDAYTNHVKRTLNYYIDDRHRQKVLDRLMDRFFPDESQLVDQFYMSGDDLRAMDAAGMTIGSHSVSHPVMSKLSPDEQEQEIARSFDFLEANQGRLDPRTFCYPYGGFHTFSAATEQLLGKYRCDFAFNVEARDIGQPDLTARKQALPRYDCNMFPHGACRNADTGRKVNAPRV